MALARSLGFSGRVVEPLLLLDPAHRGGREHEARQGVPAEAQDRARLGDRVGDGGGADPSKTWTDWITPPAAGIGAIVLVRTPRG